MARVENVERILGAGEGAGELRPLLKQIGALVQEDSRASFERQTAFDGTRWEPRYPGMDDPFINVAGALADFADGKKRPKNRRFQRRPVLRDIGTLEQSVHFAEPGPDYVDIGADKNLAPYADIHHGGGETEQEVTEEARQNLNAWLKTNKEFRNRLGFLFATDMLVTGVVRRPIVGISDQVRKDIVELIELYFETGGQIRGKAVS